MARGAATIANVFTPPHEDSAQSFGHSISPVHVVSRSHPAIVRGQSTMIDSDMEILC